MTLARTGKTFKVTQSTQFLADDRETVDEALQEILLVYMIQGTIKSVIRL